MGNSSTIHSLVQLPNRVEIYLPSTVKVDKKLGEAERTHYLEKVMRLFAKKFGGCTAVNGTGAWVSSGNALVAEQVTIVYSYYGIVPDAEHFLERVARAVKNDLEQEAVSAVLNGTLYLF